jgi:hypothetical protein
MDAPGRPHVRVFHGDIYIERVPNAWVLVVAYAEWQTLNEPERNYMISKAIKTGLDSTLPSPQNSSPTELPPIE